MHRCKSQYGRELDRATETRSPHSFARISDRSMVWRCVC
jgi:hypothetical protein